jgi:hypothetical protein
MVAACDIEPTAAARFFIGSSLATSSKPSRSATTWNHGGCVMRYWLYFRDPHHADQCPRWIDPQHAGAVIKEP